jgi:hypothetical protein
MGVVNAIYHRFGLTLSSETEAAMQTWAKHNSVQPDSSHSYAEIEEQDPITDAFAAYIAHYQL